MKKKLFAIIISAMMIVSLLPAMAFADVNQTSAAAITKSGIRTQLKFTAAAYTGEQWAETYMNNYLKEVQTGKYKVIDTAAVKTVVEKKSAVVIDTMPAGWFAGRHLPGAINIPAPLTGNNDVNYTKKAAVKAVKAAVGTKTVKKNGKKVKVVNYNKKIVVYCGFMGCSRSHELAKDLVAAGFKNVYRYAGGITAWVDAGYAVEGTDNLVVDETAKTVSIQCTVNDDITDAAAHWFIVNNDGSMAAKAPLNTSVSTDDFYAALNKLAGDKMWNNSTEALKNGADESIDDCVAAGKGSKDYAKFEVTVTWGGKTYKLNEVVTNAKYKDVAYTGDYKIAYTGNLDNQHNAKTGCITCFGGCFMGISSGHDTPMMIEYKPANLPAAGETVTVTYKLVA